MMQTQIPSGLQALMQASQVLSSQASPTAPGPQGPQPTIAERVNQQIKQTAAPPEAGIAGLSPNMRDIGQQAGVAGQIMAQRAAQQEQTARNPEAIAQMVAQMMQSKGVAGLPAKMGFKEGGIIGFSGEVRSDVPAAAQDSGLTPELRQQYDREVTEMSFGKRMSFSPEVKRILGAIDAQKQAEFLQRERDRMSRVPSTRQPEPVDYAPAMPAVAGRRVDPTQLEGYGVPASAAGIQTVLPKPKPKAEPSARPAPAAKPETQPAPKEVVSTKIPETKVDTSGIVEPTIASLEPGITAIVPKRAEAYNKEVATDEEARKKLKASMEDLNAKEIAALEESKKTRKQLAESKAERDQFNRVRAFFEDLGNRGSTSYRTVQEGIFARDEAERLADLAHEKAVILLQKAQQAEKLGDLDRAAALKKDAYSRLVEEDKQRASFAQIVAGLAQSGYTQKMETARTEATLKSANVRTEADLAQRDRALQANLDIERQKIEGLRQDRSQTAQYNALNAALGRYNSAYETYRKIQDDNKANINLPQDSKDPVVVAARDKAIKAVNRAYEDLVVPAKATYDSIAAKVLKGYATTPSAGGSSKPDFDFDPKTGKMIPNK